MSPVVIRAFRIVALALTVVAPLSAAAQVTSGTGFAPGARTIVDLNFAGTPVGQFPQGLQPLPGAKLEVVMKDGVHMLRASYPSEFVLPLPEALPKNFTLEIELIPKACCNPVDLAVEGVISGSRSAVSAQLEWDPDHFMIVGGNPEMFQMDMPPAIAATLPSTLTTVATSFEDETVKMYTNGQRVYTLSGRKFVRGRVLRIFLGGTDDDQHAVYLARVRVADAATTIVATNAPQSGPRSVTTAVAVAPVTAVPAATTGTAAPIPATITPSSGTSGTVARTIKSSAVKCPAVTNLKAVANGPNAAILSWTPMSSSCQTIAQTAGERLSVYILTRWRTADNNSCPTDFASLNTFKVFGNSGWPLQPPWLAPNFPMCVMLPTSMEHSDISSFDDHYDLEGGAGYTYRLWPVFEANCDYRTSSCDWDAMVRPYPYSEVSVALPLMRPAGLTATVASILTAPTELRAAGWNDMIRLRWAPVTGAVSYRITRVQNTGDPETVIFEGDANEFDTADPYSGGFGSGSTCSGYGYCEFKDWTVTYGGLYSYRVWALSAPGAVSPPSKVVTQRASW